MILVFRILNLAPPRYISISYKKYIQERKAEPNGYLNKKDSYSSYEVMPDRISLIGKKSHLLFPVRPSGKQFYNIEIAVKKMSRRFAYDGLEVVYEMGLIIIITIKYQTLIIDSILIFYLCP